MAWQLVFGTVRGARKLDSMVWGEHPSLPFELVDWLEKCLLAVPSARPAGAPPSFYHRIHRLPETSYHLILRLNEETSQNGEKRFTFHALIIPSEEISGEGAEPFTPADVILSLGYSGAWTAQWEEPPKDFTTLELIQLAGLKRRIHLPAQNWEQRVGSARRAAVLAPGQVAQSCWLVHNFPGAFDLVKLFGESLLLHPDPWQIPFATAFLPGDSLEDYAWRALPPGTLRDQVPAADFPIIDLTQSSEDLPLSETFANQAEQGTRAVHSVTPVPTPAPQVVVTPSKVHPQSSKAPRSPSRQKAKSFDPTHPSLAQVRLQHASRIPRRAYLGTLVVLLIVGLMVGAYLGYKAYDLKERQHFATQSLANLAALQAKLPPVPDREIFSSEKLVEGADLKKLREFAEFLGSLEPQIPEQAGQAISLINKDRKRFVAPAEMKGILTSLMPGLQEIAKRNEIQRLLEAGDIDGAADADSQNFNRYLTLLKEIRNSGEVDVPALFHLTEALPENLPSASKKTFGEFLGKMARASLPQVDLANGLKSAGFLSMQRLAEQATTLKLPDAEQISNVVGEMERRVRENEIKRTIEERRRVIQATAEEMPIRIFDYKEAFLQEVKTSFGDRNYEIVTDRSPEVFSKHRQPQAERKPVAKLADEVAAEKGSLIVCLYDQKFDAPLLIAVVASANAPLELKVDKKDLVYAEKSLRISPSLLGVIGRLEKSGPTPIQSSLEVPDEVLTTLAPASAERKPILINQAGAAISDLFLRLNAEKVTIRGLAVASANQKVEPIFNFGKLIVSAAPNASAAGGESFADYLTKLGKSGAMENLDLLPDYLKASIKNAAKAYPGVDKQSFYTPMMNGLSGKADLGKRLRHLRSLAEQQPKGSKEDRKRMEPFGIGIKNALSDEAIDALAQLAKPGSIPVPAEKEERYLAVEKAIAILDQGFPLKISGKAGGGVIFEVVVADSK